jgi:hypothetical protein
MAEPSDKDARGASPPPAPAPPAPKGSSAWAWPLALVLVTLIGVGGLLIYKAVNAPTEMIERSGRIVGKTIDETRQIVGQVYEKIREGLRPNVNYRTLIISQFSQLSARPKLVVLTETLSVEVVKRSEKSVLWGLLNLGDTVVRLKAYGNKVQFYIPISEIRPEDFSYDPAAKKLVVRVPAPVLDRDVVEVQSDPSKIEVETKVGWARLSRYSGKSLETRAREALREEVLGAADSPPIREMATLEARKALTALFHDLAGSLQDGVTLVFEFQEDHPAKAQDAAPAR